MGPRIRIGLIGAGAILVLVFFYAGIQDAWPHEQEWKPPSLKPTQAAVVVDLKTYPGVQVYPGAGVDTECSARGNKQRLELACTFERVER